MKYCDSCGGILGRDCFNPVECAHISHSMQQIDSQELEHLRAINVKLLEALKAAHKHLEYCGYGDSWERECAEGLDAQISEAIAAAEPKHLPPETITDEIPW